MRSKVITRAWRRRPRTPVWASARLAGLAFGAIAVAGCGGADDTSSGQAANESRAAQQGSGGREEGAPRREDRSSATNSREAPARSAGARGSGGPGRQQGDSRRRNRPGTPDPSVSTPRAAARPTTKRLAEPPSGAAQSRDSVSRAARIIRRIREAEKREPSERLGCVRFSVTSVRGEIQLIGPPPPAAVTARRVAGGVLIGYRFGSKLPSSETCRPFGLVLTVWSGRRLDPTYRARSEDFQLRGKSGRRLVKLPVEGRPPYRASVASVTITGRRGPRVDVAVP